MADSAVIMVAPNGARRGKLDHPALPITIEETVGEAVLAHSAGASVLHAHVRDANGRHCLDAGRYRELIAQMKLSAPDMIVQITTEAVGQYSPQEQADCLFAVRPAMVSIALRELAPDDGLGFARDVYHRASGEGIHVQHILYDATDLKRFIELRDAAVVPQIHASLLFVLGRYATNGLGHADDLKPFMKVGVPPGDTWTVCAFGGAERRCIEAAFAAGGHARVGFENNIHRADGQIASCNAELVADAADAAGFSGRRVASIEDTRRLFRIGA